MNLYVIKQKLTAIVARFHLDFMDSTTYITRTINNIPANKFNLIFLSSREQWGMNKDNTNKQTKN